jgi:hypothetical protein
MQGVLVTYQLSVIEQQADHETTDNKTTSSEKASE